MATATTTTATTTLTPAAKRLAQLLVDRFKPKPYRRKDLIAAMQVALGDKKEDHLRAIFEWAATDPFWSDRITNATFPDRYVLSSLHTMEDRFAKATKAAKIKPADQPGNAGHRDAEVRLAALAGVFANPNFPNLSTMAQLVLVCAAYDGKFDRDDFTARTNSDSEEVDRAYEELVNAGWFPSDPDPDPDYDQDPDYDADPDQD